MLTIYMSVWSVVMILVMGFTRVRHVPRLLVMSLITFLVLFLSQVLFEQLALSAGVAPNMILFDPGTFVSRGPIGWLALLIMPCGWLGPMLSLHLVERWKRERSELA